MLAVFLMFESADRAGGFVHDQWPITPEAIQQRASYDLRVPQAMPGSSECEIGLVFWPHYTALRYDELRLGINRPPHDPLPDFLHRVGLKPRQDDLYESPKRPGDFGIVSYRVVEIGWPQRLRLTIQRALAPAAPN